jgi:hypothetical protein
MRTIYKYPLKFPKFEFTTRVKLPEAFRILKLADQRGTPTLWCDVDTGTFDQEIEVIQCLTGQHLPEDIDEWAYLETLQEMEGSLVSHYFWRYARD